jgi:hypothetical protein
MALAAASHDVTNSAPDSLHVLLVPQLERAAETHAAIADFLMEGSGR